MHRYFASAILSCSLEETRSINYYGTAAFQNFIEQRALESFFFPYLNIQEKEEHLSLFKLFSASLGTVSGNSYHNLLVRWDYEE